MQNASQKVKDYKEKCKTLTPYFIYILYRDKESVFMHFSLLNIDVDTKYHPPHIQSMRVLVQNERFTSFITQSVMSFLISKGNLFFSKHIIFFLNTTKSNYLQVFFFTIFSFILKLLEI